MYACGKKEKDGSVGACKLGHGHTSETDEKKKPKIKYLKADRNHSAAYLNGMILYYNVLLCIAIAVKRKRRVTTYLKILSRR